MTLKRTMLSLLMLGFALAPLGLKAEAAMESKEAKEAKEVKEAPAAEAAAGAEAAKEAVKEPSRADLLAGKFDIKGVIQNWFVLAEGSDKAMNDAGDRMRHLRFLVTGKPFDRVTMVVMPELVGGFTLLHGYADVDLTCRSAKCAGHGTCLLRVGQFVAPFGHDRMFPVWGYDRVDYSLLQFDMGMEWWDTGVMVQHDCKHATLQLCAIEGLGMNPLLAAPATGTDGVRDRHDFSGKLDVHTADKKGGLGFSFYNGYGRKGDTLRIPYYIPTTTTAQYGQERIWWTGAHLYAESKWGHLKAEWINADTGRWGVNVEKSLKIGAKCRLLAFWDRMEDARGDILGETVLGGAYLVDPAKGLRFTLQAQGKATGPSQSPTSSEIILQTMVTF